MTIDISKIRPGDKVTLVPLEVANVGQGSNYVAVLVSSGRVWHFDADLIAAHHPAPREFKGGDRVRAGSNSHDVWVIEHIAYGRAWISRSQGQEGWLWSLDDLTLVEGGE